jgi:hypothetical protein
VPCLLNRPALGCAAPRTGVLFSAGLKTVPATSTTPGYRRVSNGNCIVNLFHNYWCKTSLKSLLVSWPTPCQTLPALAVSDQAFLGRMSWLSAVARGLLHGGRKDHVNPVVARAR